MILQPEIVLVEDNSSDAELASITLDELGLFNRTKIISNGEAAVNFFMSGNSPNKENTKNLKLIFLDLMLPKLNGFEILEKIDTEYYTKEIPVVIFSSSEIYKDVERAYSLGVNGYLVKPIDFTYHQYILKSAINFWL